jgi:TonB family protein
VIPILVGEATMPTPEDLPEDLVPLSYRNGFELRDSRWESDVTLLIRAIEKACGGPAEASPQLAPRLPEPRPATGEKPSVHESGLVRIAARRNHQIAEHLDAARQALDALQYGDALEACEKALLLDPQNKDARDLQQRAEGALDEQKIQGWLGEARQLLSREQVQDAQLTAASELIDQAIALKPVHEAATALRGEVLALRRHREHDRDAARHVLAVLARAREHLELEEFDACIAGCDDALTVSSGSAEARELRQRAVAARDERRRNREIKQRAQPSPIPDHAVAAPQPEADIRRSSRAPGVAAAAVAVLLAGLGAWVLLGRSGATGQSSSQTVPSSQQPSSPSPPASQAGLPARTTDSATTPASAANPPPPVASVPQPAENSTPPTAAASTPATTVPPSDPATLRLGKSGGPAGSKQTGQLRKADAATAKKGDPLGAAASKAVAAPEPTMPASSPKDTTAAPAQSAKPSAEKQTDEAPDVKPPAREVTKEGTTTRIAQEIEFKEPTRLKYVAPVYPKAALDKGVQGAVTLAATVGEDGKVRNVKVLKSIPLLDQAAIDALKQWEYAPGTRNGAAFAVEITVTITFSM